MFSQNGRISEKQMRRMMVLLVYASLIFVVPSLAAWLFGESIFSGLCVFVVMGAGYVAVIYGISAYFQKNKNRKEKNSCFCMVLLIQVLRWIVRLAFYGCLTIEVLREGQVPFMPQNKTGNLGSVGVALPLFLTAFYGAYAVSNTKKVKREQKGKVSIPNRRENKKDCLKITDYGMEKQGRIYELLFWLLYIPLAVVLLFGIREMDVSIFIPHCSLSIWTLLLRAYSLLIFLTPVEYLLLARPFLQRKQTLEKRDYLTVKSYLAIVGTIVLVCVYTLCMVGIYGVQGAGGEKLLTVAIMRYIRVPFGLIERVDVLLIWFFLIGCFVLMEQTLFFSEMLLSVLFPNAKALISLLVIFCVALILVIFLPTFDDVLWLYRIYGAVLEVPLSVLLPILCLVIQKILSYEIPYKREVS